MQYIRCTHPIQHIPAVRMVSVEEIRRRPQRAEGPATVLSIGTATPSNCVDQSSFPDYYFRVTNSEHKTELKHKFNRMCEGSTIKKRYIHLTEELLSENPSIAACMAPSLDARQAIVAAEVPRLGKEAAEKAIKEWGQPRSSITHLIFCTSTAGVDIPSADFHLTKLLGLRPSVNRLMMSQHGCYGGASALRVAKDLAENNAGARVLIVCCEVTAVFFRGPNEAYLGDLVAQAIFGDAAGAAVVGSDPVAGSERPFFEIVSGAQTIIPDSEGRIEVHVGEAGMIVELLKDVPELISGNIEGCLKSAFSPLGIMDWNSIFWIAQPGGPKILNGVETCLGLKPDKLRASRHVLSEYGNVSSPTVLLVLDEMRKSSAVEGRSTTGEGLDWGVLFGFGPGLTVETLVLRSMPIDH